MSLYNMSKKQWGPPTWSLLHCIALKAKDTMTYNQLQEAKRLIERIIQNLPCPICSTHAQAYFKKVPFQSVTTLTQLRTYLFDFHNNVNLRINNPTITYEEHVLLYEKMEFSMVLSNMLSIYRHMGNTNVTMMLYSFHRQTMMKEIHRYFSTNAYLYYA